MKVFKFGGATVKDAASVKQLAAIVKQYPDDDLVVVVSAMDKMTNALEGLIDSYFFRKDDLDAKFDHIRSYHYNILDGLFQKEKDHDVYADVNRWFEELRNHIDTRAVPQFDFEYDQIVCYGELISTTIVHHYLRQEKMNCEWFDARKLIQTDSLYREARVDWTKTTDHIIHDLLPYFSRADHRKIALTQGFIGASSNHHTTSLGREGSDFSAAIFGHVMNAREVIIWKDVPGILNADPRYYENTIKIERLSYREAMEMSYFGAKVIHPKTIKPLQNKLIPLIVKDFYNPSGKGTLIEKPSGKETTVPFYIVKIKQVLISISPSDFSFITTDHLHQIFGLLSKYGIRLNLMQNSAISFSICVDAHQNIEKLLNSLHASYGLKYNTDLHLITIRRYNESLIDEVTGNREVLLIQRSRRTIRLVVKA